MVIDIIAIAVLVIALVVGYRDGLIRQALSLAGVVIGVVAANMLAPKISVETGAKYEVVYVALCVGVPFICGMLASLITRFLNITVVLGTINNMLGAVTCAAKFVVLLSLVAVYAPRLIEIKPEAVQDSYAFDWLSKVGYKLMTLL